MLGAADGDAAGSSAAEGVAHAPQIASAPSAANDQPSPAQRLVEAVLRVKRARPYINLAWTEVRDALQREDEWSDVSDRKVRRALTKANAQLSIDGSAAPDVKTWECSIEECNETQLQALSALETDGRVHKGVIDDRGGIGSQLNAIFIFVETWTSRRLCAQARCCTGESAPRPRSDACACVSVQVLDAPWGPASNAKFEEAVKISGVKIFDASVGRGHRTDLALAALLGPAAATAISASMPLSFAADAPPPPPTDAAASSSSAAATETPAVPAAAEAAPASMPPTMPAAGPRPLVPIRTPREEFTGAGQTRTPPSYWQNLDDARGALTTRPIDAAETLAERGRRLHLPQLDPRALLQEFKENDSRERVAYAQRLAKPNVYEHIFATTELYLYLLWLRCMVEGKRELHGGKFCPEKMKLPEPAMNKYPCRRSKARKLNSVCEGCGAWPSEGCITKVSHPRRGQKWWDRFDNELIGKWPAWWQSSRLCDGDSPYEGFVAQDVCVARRQLLQLKVLLARMVFNRGDTLAIRCLALADICRGAQHAMFDGVIYFSCCPRCAKPWSDAECKPEPTRQQLSAERAAAGGVAEWEELTRRAGPAGRISRAMFHEVMAEHCPNMPLNIVDQDFNRLKRDPAGLIDVQHHLRAARQQLAEAIAQRRQVLKHDVQQPGFPLHYRMETDSLSLGLFGCQYSTSHFCVCPQYQTSLEPGGITLSNWWLGQQQGGMWDPRRADRMVLAKPLPWIDGSTWDANRLQWSSTAYPEGTVLPVRSPDYRHVPPDWLERSERVPAVHVHNPGGSMDIWYSPLIIGGLTDFNGRTRVHPGSCNVPLPRVSRGDYEGEMPCPAHLRPSGVADRFEELMQWVEAQAEANGAAAVVPYLQPGFAPASVLPEPPPAVAESSTAVAGPSVSATEQEDDSMGLPPLEAQLRGAEVDEDVARSDDDGAGPPDDDV